MRFGSALAELIRPARGWGLQGVVFECRKECRKSNNAALCLKARFWETGRRSGFYSDADEDAVIIRKDL